MKKMKPEQIAAKAANTVAARHKVPAPKASRAAIELADDISGDLGYAPSSPRLASQPGSALPALPKLPRAPRKPKPVRPCECGCGGSTKSRFVPGHDGRLHGWVLRVERGVIKLADIQPEGVQMAVAAALRVKKAAKAEPVKL